MNHNALARGTLVIILGGGQGERLYPLTRDRTKPAVPFGGGYRIIDFTLSNSINSGLKRVYVLTQYKSISLDRHLRMGWNCLHEEFGEFIVSVPPQQRMGERWYEGTADAIYQNIYTLEQERPDRVLILAGDHVYKMNYLDMLAFHEEKGGEITVGCAEVPVADGRRLGVMAADEDMRIRNFEEKPDEPNPMPGRPDVCLGSMGIYVFNTSTLVHLVSEDARQDTTHDFGTDILPRVIHDRPVYAFPFRDPKRQRSYWRDIGTVDAYWQANMDLLEEVPEFDLCDADWPVWTYHGQDAPARFISAGPDHAPGVAVNSIVAEGCVIRGAKVERSVLAPRVVVDPGAEVTESILMGRVTIGGNSRLRRTIVDKDVVIPPGVEIGWNAEADRRRFAVTDQGIVVVPKNVPPGPEFWAS